MPTRPKQKQAQEYPGHIDLDERKRTTLLKNDQKIAEARLKIANLRTQIETNRAQINGLVATKMVAEQALAAVLVPHNKLVERVLKDGGFEKDDVLDPITGEVTKGKE